MAEEIRFCGSCGVDNTITAEPPKSSDSARAQTASKKNNTNNFLVALLLVIIIIGIATSKKTVPSTHTSSENTPNNARNEASAKEILLNAVKLQYSWSKEGFGNVMTANFVVTNPTGIAFKDFEITCVHTAPSGTVIDKNVRTIYEVVGVNSTWKKRDFNMGFIHSQAQRSSCHITDLVPIW